MSGVYGAYSFNCFTKAYTTNRKLNPEFDTAKELKIPYQLEIMPESTGTDADALALAPNGSRAGTVSIPLRYMHTPVEVIDIRDVELSAQLLAAFAGRCGRA